VRGWVSTNVLAFCVDVIAFATYVPLCVSLTQYVSECPPLRSRRVGQGPRAVAGLGDKNVVCLGRNQCSRPSSSIAVAEASRTESVVAPVINSVGYLILAWR
jgi:hypothetical protein